jgi:outer membrane receptor protein involved in Fe transport
MKRILLFAISFLLFSHQIIFAGTTGKLAGRVTDRGSGEPLPFVNVLIQGTNYGAATDLDGNFVILNIPPQTYSVKAQYIGYQPMVVNDVRISIDQTTNVDFQLAETAVELEAVVVEAQIDLIQKDVTSSQSLVSSDQIEALPVVEFDDVLQLQPGVTRDADGAFHIRGGRTSEIAYWVNGVSVTDGYDNSRGIEIDNSSIQELQVISGTFNAEYGNAMSGIVNTVTKEGGMDYHGNIKLWGGDYASNFTTYFPNIDNFNPVENYNLQTSLGGPFPFTNNLLTFFVNARYVYDDGWIYGEKRYNIDGTPGDGKFVATNWNRRFMLQSNLSFWVAQKFKFLFEFLYSDEEFQDYEHDYRWNPDGNVNKFADSKNGTFTFTHLISSATYYTLKGSYFEKEFNEYLFADPFDSRYLHPDSLNTVGFAFKTVGTNLKRFNRKTQTGFAKIDFTSQVHPIHLLKIGIEGRLHKLNFDDYNLIPQTTDGIEDSIFTPMIPTETSTARDLYTAEPIELAAYIQDKIELDNVIINFGLRFDYIDSRGKVLVDPTDPNINIPLRPGLDTLSLEEREPFFYKDSEPKWQVSPRFGVAYPIGVGGVVHFSFGTFLQVPTFLFLYNKGDYKVPETGSNHGVYGNPDLKPQTTISYELGFRQEFMREFLIDATIFYRDIRDWITSGPLVSTRNLVTYSSYINKDYANVQGITLTFNKRLSDNYAFDFNYTFQVAQGSNSKPEDEFNQAKSNNEPALFLTPLDWDQNHILNFSFFFGSDQWGASLITRYGTGLPYTPQITQFTSDRGISSGLDRNSRRKPNQFSMDLKLNYVFKISSLDLNVFMNIFNLLDNRVVVNVHSDTGEPDFTTEGQNIGEDPARPNTVEEFFIRPWHYGQPRLIQLGFDLNF